MKKKTINRITSLNILSTILLQGIAFISAPVISRLLGPENYGITSVYITWALIVNVIFSVQTHSTIPMAKARYPESKQDSFQSSILGLSIVMFAISTVIIFRFSGYISNRLKMPRLMLLFIVLHAFGQYCVEFLNVRFTHNYDADKNIILSVSVSLSIFLGSILLINLFPKEINYWGRIIGMSLVYALFGVGICGALLVRGKVFYNKEYWHFALSLSIPIVVHALSGQILNQSDRVMLQQMNGSVAAGIYSLTSAFGGIMTTIWAALNNSWTPFVYDYLKNNQEEQVEQHGKNYLELFTVLTIGFMLLAPEVFSVFASEEYWSGTRTISIFALSAFFRFLYAFPATYEFYYMKTKAIAAGTLLAGIGNILMNYLLIPVWGVTGAAFATMMSNVLLFLFHDIFVKAACMPKVYPFKIRRLLPYILIVIAVSCLVYIDVSVWWMRWTAGVVLGCLELSRVLKRKSIF